MTACLNLEYYHANKWTISKYFLDLLCEPDISSDIFAGCSKVVLLLWIRIFSASKMHLSPLLEAKAAVRSKVVVQLLLIYCLLYLLLFVEILCLSLFCCALLCVHSSFATIFKRKRKLVALLSFITNVLLLKMFCGSSSLCGGLVCSMWLWYFLIILTYFMWSPAGKGLTSWLSYVWCILVFRDFPMWCSRSGVVLDCIDSLSLPSSLLGISSGSPQVFTDCKCHLIGFDR